MNTWLRSLLAPPLAAGFLAACWPAMVHAQDNDDAFRRQAEKSSVGPDSPPRANVTGFGQALRCMDGLFRSYGVKSIAILLQSIPDATTKVNVGAKDMFMSATSQMTRSSRAIRLIPYIRPDDPGGAVFTGREDVLKTTSFSVQGSISQFDETTLRKQRDGAICLGPLCVGAAESDSFSGMSLDLSMIETEGLTLLPGVTSKNFVLIRRKGKGFDGDLSLTKFGVQYNFTFTRSDGQGQALRSLVELSVIELYGRLLKIPYWTCLGLTDADPGVAGEIEDWWESLREDLPTLVTYLQLQMQIRGLYKGEIDGQLNEESRRAVRAYKGALGLTPDLNVDAAFFKRYLAANHADVQRAAAARLAEIEATDGPVGAAAPEAAAAGSPGSSAGTGAAIAIENRKGDGYVHRRGEAVEIEVAVSRPGFLYCYLLDESRRFTQFFPNGVQSSAAVKAGARIAFPGNFGFRLFASRKGITETVACFATQRDIGPDALGSRPAIRDVQALKGALDQRAGQAVEVGVYDVKVQ